MKRLLTLVMAACMVLGALGTASAIDVSIKGQWDFSYGLYTNRSAYDGNNAKGHADNFVSAMRVRNQVEFKASETLSALLYFEIGDTFFGRGAGADGTGTSGRGAGGQLDADGVSIEIKRAYMDWIVPGTALQTRMGIQGIALPFAVSNSPIMDADVAGVSLAYQFNPTIGITGFWARPFDYSNGETDSGTGKNRLDEMDLFGLTLPITTSAVKVTPWAMVGSVGKDSGYYTTTSARDISGGAVPGRGRYYTRDERAGQSFAWWAGFAFDLPLVDPFIVKLDAMMGGMDQNEDAGQFGWFVTWKLGYDWKWGKTSFIGWYSSGDGDDAQKDHKYGTIPIVSDDYGFQLTPYGLSGQRGINRDQVLSGNGVGMWGIGLEVTDVSFIEKLNHTARVMFMRGTNNGDNISNGYNDPFYSQAAGGAHNGYFITSDSMWEFNLLNQYVFDKNFSMALDFAYIHLDLSKQRGDSRDDVKDTFAAMLSFQYKF